MREGDVFSHHVRKEMIAGVSLSCSAHFNNSHITLETQGWKVQLFFFPAGSQLFFLSILLMLEQ